MTFITTLNRKLDSFPKTYNEVWIAIIATFAGMMFGFDVSSISAFISHDSYRNYFNNPGSVEQGAITAAVSGGCFIGSLASDVFSEAIGRRTTLIISGFLWIVGAIIQSSSHSVAQLVVGRVVSGSAIGIGSAVTPTYVSEISRAKNRGLIGGLYQLAITLGILVMFFIGYGCTFIDGTTSWRVAWALQMIPGVFLLSGVIFLPESPRWLANHDQWDAGVDIIRRVNKKEDEDTVNKEINELKESIEIFKLSKEVTYVDLFNKKNWKSSTVAISAQIWNQLTGMNVMMYYIVYIFEMVGFEGNTVLVSSSAQYVINFGVTFLSLPLPDLVGRRPLMVWGGLGMMILLFINGALFAAYSEKIPNVAKDATVVITIPPEHKAAGKAIMAFSYLFVATFASTWAVCSWAFFPEVLPTRTRSKAASVAVAADWAFNFAIAMFTPPAFHNISWKLYFIFGTFCGCMSIHTYLQYPETKGKTLEEIDMIFQSNVPAWHTAKFAIPATVVEHLDEKNVSTAHVETVKSSASDRSV